ncbi:putative ribonuclease H-like domain-containing protein [Tanacetum coccineum]
MDLETAQTTTTTKLPILKQGEYDMWRLRIDQYFQVQDYALWDVIENGNSFKPVPQTTTNADGSSTSLIPGPVTTEEKVQKKNDVKAKSMLLMELPNEYLMKFNQYKNAKTLFAAIQTRFCGNEAIKKTQKTLLKQMYENFSAPSTESLDSIFNRLQNIISQLAILGENISQEDLNLKILRSLPSEWNTHVVVWRNKPDLDTIIFDDLYNNFKIVEQELVLLTLKLPLLALKLALLVLKRDGFKVAVSIAEHEDKKVFLENWNAEDLGIKIVGTGIKTALEGLYMADDEVPTNIALMAFSDSKVHNDKTCSKTYLKSFETLKTQLDDLRIEFNKSEFNLATYKRGLAYVEEQLVFYKKNEVIFYEQLAVLKRDVSYKDSELSMLKSELEKLKQQKESNQLKIENFNNASKSLDKLIGSQITDKSRKGMGFVSYNAVPPPPTGLFSHPKFDLSNSGLEEFQQPEFKGYRPKTSKSVSEDISNEVRESPDAQLVKELVLDDKLEKKTVFPTVAKVEFVDLNNKKKQLGNQYSMLKCIGHKLLGLTAITIKGKGVPRAVLMETGLRPLNTARPVNTAHYKTTVYSARPMSCFSKSAQSTCHPQKEDQGYVDSGRSRHMTGNMSYLSDFKEFDGGYVTFGRGAKGGRITIVAGTNSNDSVGTEESASTDHSSEETGSSQDYILMPLWKDGSLFDSLSSAQTRRMINEQGFISVVYEGKTHEDLHTFLFACFLSQEEPKKVIQALKDPSWIEAMQEELLQFKLQQVWTLVDLPYGKRAIGTTWVYRNKKDERGIVIRNKARLVAHGYTQDEGKIMIVFAPVEQNGCIETRRMRDMDVKNAFLYSKIKGEIYVCQPSGFEDPEFRNKVYKLEKALYGLHQAPRAWYDTLSTYLLDNGFQRGQIDKTLFIKRIKSDILLVQMSSIGQLTFFLGLQVTQKDDGFFISQDTYVDEILKKFSFSTVKTASTPMETSKPLLKDAEAEDVDVYLYRSMIRSLMYLTASRPDIMFVVCACYLKDSLFDLEAYTDSVYAGASLDRKSITGGCQFLRRRLISWQCKKHTIVANFTTEAEYVAAASCFKNPVFHSKTKHIEIRHHFIRDSNEKKLIQMIKIHTDHNVADLLTKAFDVGRFQYLIASIGMLNL